MAAISEKASADTSDDDSSDGLSTKVPKRLPRNSRSNRSIKSTTLAYYPNRWQDLQTCAKKKMQRDIALFQAFPTRERDLNVATRCIMKALAEFDAEGKKVEDGTLTTQCPPPIPINAP
jgi:hypothetical protein